MKRYLPLAFALFAVMLPLFFADTATLVDHGNPLHFLPAMSWLFFDWPLSTLGFIAGAFLLTGGAVSRLALPSRPLLGTAALLMLCAFLGLIHASVVDYAQSGALYILILAAFYISADAFSLNTPAARRMLHCAAAAAFAYVLYAGFSEFFQSNAQALAYAQEQNIPVSAEMQGRINDNRICGPFINCNIFAGYLLLVTPLAAGRFFRIPKAVALRYFFLLTAAGAGLFLLFQTGSRAAVLSLIAGLALALLLFLNRKGQIIAVVSSLMLGTGFLLFAHFVLHRNLFSLKNRIDYDLVALKTTFSSVFGTGWGDFFHVYQMEKFTLISPEGVTQLALNEAPRFAHNLLLDLGAACGFFGILAGLAVILLPFLANRSFLIRLKKQGFRGLLSLRFLTLFGLLMFFIHAQFEFSFFSPAAIITAILLSVSVLPTRRKTPGKPCPCKRFLIPLYAVLMLALSGFIFHEAVLVRHQERAVGALSQQALIAELNGTPDIQESEVPPESPFPYMIQAQNAIAAKQYDTALSALDAAIARSPERADFYAQKGMLLGALRRYNQAVSAFGEAVRHFPLHDGYRAHLKKARSHVTPAPQMP